MSQDTRKDKRAKIVSLNVRYKSATVDEDGQGHSTLRGLSAAPPTAEDTSSRSVPVPSRPPAGRGTFQSRKATIMGMGSVPPVAPPRSTPPTGMRAAPTSDQPTRAAV